MADAFVRRHMLELHEAGGIENLGSVKWQLMLCLVAVYLICYFSLWKGISTSGKVSHPVNYGDGYRYCTFDRRRELCLSKSIVRFNSTQLKFIEKGSRMAKTTQYIDIAAGKGCTVSGI